MNGIEKLTVYSEIGTSAVSRNTSEYEIELHVRPKWIISPLLKNRSVVYWYIDFTVKAICTSQTHSRSFIPDDYSTILPVAEE